MVVLLFNETPTLQNIPVEVFLRDGLSTSDGLSVKDLWTEEAWLSNGRISVKDADAWDSQILRVPIA